MMKEYVNGYIDQKMMTNGKWQGSTDHHQIR